MSSTALNRRSGLGFTFAVDSSGGTSFVTLGAIIDGAKISGAKKQMAPIKILSDTFIKYSPGQIEPGTYSFSILFDPNDTGTSTTGGSGILGSLFASTSATAANWQINYPGGTAGATASRTFKGFVVGLGEEIKIENSVMQDVEIQIDGNPGFPTSA